MDYRNYDYNQVNYPSSSGNFPFNPQLNVPVYSDNVPVPFDPRLLPKFPPAVVLKPLQSPHVVIDNKTDDELWVETWLAKLGKITINLDDTIKINTPERLTQTDVKRTFRKPAIYVARKVLFRCFNVIESLQKAEDFMRQNVTKMTSDEWREKTVEIGCLKDELSALFTQVEGPNTMSSLKALLDVRRKKRAAQKQRRMKKQERKESEKLERIQMHKDIDQWFRKEQELIQQAKNDEKLKRDADCILSEVTKKKAEAKKHLALVNSLVKLRSLRESEALQKGEEISLEDKVAFSNITDRLIKIWENSLRAYGAEEVALKRTLEQSVEDLKEAELAQEQKLISDWDEIFFGPKTELTAASLPFVSADTDVETFVAIRKSWDTFLTPASDKKGTNIPIGWVLPEKNASDEWVKYLTS